LLEHRFYIYPPLHFLVLGSWARLFGISAVSFQAFQICSLATSSLLAAILFLRTENKLLALAAPFALTAYLWDDGVRAETTAVVLLLGGCVLLLWPSRWSWFGAGLLLAATCGASPSLALYALAILLALICVLLLWRHKEPVRSRQSCYYFFVAGFLLVSLIVVVALNRELPSFLQDMLHHSQLLSPGSMTGNLALYGTMLSFGLQWLKIPLIATALLLPAIVVLLKPESEPMRTISAPLCWSLLMGSCVMVLTTVPLGQRLPTIELVSLIVIGLSLSTRRLASRRFAIQFGVCGMIVAANVMTPLDALTFNKPNKVEVARVLEELSQTPHERIFADDYALWWLFDWNPPPNFSSYRFSYHHEEQTAPTSLKDGEVWIVPQSEIQPVPLRLFGHTFRSLPVNRNVFLILDSSIEKNYTR